MNCNIKKVVKKNGRCNSCLDNENLNNLNYLLVWTLEEIKLIEDRFGSFIQKKIYPSGEEIKKMIKTTKINRTPPVIKAKLQHLMKSQ